MWLKDIKMILKGTAVKWYRQIRELFHARFVEILTLYGAFPQLPFDYTC